MRTFQSLSALSPQSEEEDGPMSCGPYASVVGSLMYAMVDTFPNISHVISVVSRYMTNLVKEDWHVAKRMF